MNIISLTLEHTLEPSDSTLHCPYRPLPLGSPPRPLSPNRPLTTHPSGFGSSLRGLREPLEHNNTGYDHDNNNNDNNENNNHDDHHHPTLTYDMTGSESASIGYGFAVGTGVGMMESKQYRPETGLTLSSHAQGPGPNAESGLFSDRPKVRETLSRRAMWEGLQRVVRLHLSPKQVLHYVISTFRRIDHVFILLLMSLYPMFLVCLIYLFSHLTV